MGPTSQKLPRKMKNYVLIHSILVDHNRLKSCCQETQQKGTLVGILSTRKFYQLTIGVLNKHIVKKQ